MDFKKNQTIEFYLFKYFCFKIYFENISVDAKTKRNDFIEMLEVCYSIR